MIRLTIAGKRYKLSDGLERWIGHVPDCPRCLEPLTVFASCHTVRPSIRNGESHTDQRIHCDRCGWEHHLKNGKEG